MLDRATLYAAVMSVPINTAISGDGRFITAEGAAFGFREESRAILEDGRIIDG
jgi:hypothetical protein